jgi:prepilin peptidase CpaA
MNLVLLLVYPAIMAWAAASDLLTMRISNRLVLSLLVAFAVLVPLSGMPLDLLYGHLGAGAVVLIGAFAFFAFGWIGGGDAKLAAVTALWLGWPLLLPYVVYSALFGGALTLSILLLRRWPLPAALVGVSWVDRLHNPQTGVPYGLALAAGGMLLYADSFIFNAFAV